MPRSKRDKKISLTRTKKKGLESKNSVVDEVRKCATKYKNLFAFSYHHMRNNKIKELRLKWRDNSRLLLGKNRVMALALGRTSKEEVAENIHLISQKLVGTRGLFFTNAPKEEVLKFFDTYSEADFARSGNIATETVEIPEGPMEQFPHSLEPQLRKLGLPTEMRRGIPALVKAHTICKEGEVLNPEKARLLKLFEYKMADFKLTMEFFWNEEGTFEDLGRTEGVVFKQKPPKKPREIKKTSKENKEETEDKEVEEDEEKEDMDDEEKENEEDKEDEEEDEEMEDEDEE